MPTRAELIWSQSEHLFAKWQKGLASDPRGVRREVRLYLLWLKRLEPVDDEAHTIRDVLTEMALEVLIEAVLHD